MAAPPPNNTVLDRRAYFDANLTAITTVSTTSEVSTFFAATKQPYTFNRAGTDFVYAAAERHDVAQLQTVNLLKELSPGVATIRVTDQSDQFLGGHFVQHAGLNVTPTDAAGAQLTLPAFDLTSAVPPGSAIAYKTTLQGVFFAPTGSIDSMPAVASSKLDRGAYDQQRSMPQFMFLETGTSSWFDPAVSTAASLWDIDEVYVQYNSNVDGDTVTVEGKISREDVDPSPATVTALAKVEAFCSNVDLSSYEKLGSLEEYKSLLDKARAIQTSLTVSHGMGSVDMGESVALAGEISLILTQLSSTLDQTVTIDDSQLIAEVTSFFSKLSEVDAALKQFEISITQSATVKIPKSLTTLSNTIEGCSTKVNSVMGFMNSFITTTAAGASALGPEYAMSSERRSQLDAAHTALDTISSLGNGISTDLGSDIVTALKEKVETLNSETKNNLTTMKSALDAMTWLTHPTN